MSPAYKGVKRLIKERPKWLSVVEAALECAKEYEEFAGSWVLNKAKKKGTEWFPGLRALVRYQILKHEDTTRGGRRAYYTVPDQQAVEKALHELRSET